MRGSSTASGREMPVLLVQRAENANALHLMSLRKAGILPDAMQSDTQHVSKLNRLTILGDSMHYSLQPSKRHIAKTDVQ